MRVFNRAIIFFGFFYHHLTRVVSRVQRAEVANVFYLVVHWRNMADRHRSE